MKKFFVILCMTILAVSCSKDDTGSIVGTWEVSRFFEGYYENGKLIEGGWYSASSEDGVFTFKSNGTGYGNVEDKYNEFSWDYDKREKVILLYDSSYPNTADVCFKIESIKTKTMVWIIEEDIYEQDGLKCSEVDKVEFKKK